MLNERLPRRWVLQVFKHRWLASTLLLVCFDVATFLALRKGGNHPQPFEHFDKVLHGVGFIGLTVLGSIALSFDWFKKNRDSYFMIWSLNVIIWMAYGGLIEIVHAFLPYRDASVGDFLADGIGILIGQFFVWRFKLYPELKLDD